MELTPEQTARFREEGWLVLPELFLPEEVALLRPEADAIPGRSRRGGPA